MRPSRTKQEEMRELITPRKSLGQQQSERMGMAHGTCNPLENLFVSHPHTHVWHVLVHSPLHLTAHPSAVHPPQKLLPIDWFTHIFISLHLPVSLFAFNYSSTLRQLTPTFRCPRISSSGEQQQKKDNNLSTPKRCSVSGLIITERRRNCVNTHDHTTSEQEVDWGRVSQWLIKLDWRSPHKGHCSCLRRICIQGQIRRLSGCGSILQMLAKGSSSHPLSHPSIQSVGCW